MNVNMWINLPVKVEYFSKPQRLFTYNISSRFGGYYANGSRYNITADIGYRFQPYVGIALNASYNDIHLAAPWNNTRLWLIGPRIDITFTNKVFLTTFLQYNSQQKNINLNTRFQWRYRPASDLFLVYTDNYYSSPLYVRNRAFVLKATYWWNNWVNSQYWPDSYRVVSLVSETAVPTYNWLLTTNNIILHFIFDTFE